MLKITMEKIRKRPIGLVSDLNTKKTTLQELGKPLVWAYTHTYANSMIIV